jgi:hypothetical protein
MAKLSKNDASAYTPTFLVREAKRIIYDQCISTKEKELSIREKSKYLRKKKFILNIQLLRILLVARSNWSKMARLWTWMIKQIAIMPVTSMEMSINRII